MDLLEEMRKTAVKIGWKFLGTPYIWGGDDPMAGFDCSGFVIELLKSVGVLPRSGDWNAQGLWNKFGIVDGKFSAESVGCLAFWKSSVTARIVHVEFCIGKGLTIGASGGGSENVTVQNAIDRNAYVKVRPIRQKNLRGFVDPFEQE